MQDDSVANRNESADIVARPESALWSNRLRCRACVPDICTAFLSL